MLDGYELLPLVLLLLMRLCSLFELCVDISTRLVFLLLFSHLNDAEFMFRSNDGVDDVVSLLSKGNSDGSRPDMTPSQCMTIVSSSVHEGLEAQLKPTMPRPLDNRSPKIEG